MNSMQMQKMCQKQVDAVVDRMHELCAKGQYEDANALYSEISDWIGNVKGHEVMSLDYLNEMWDNK